MKKTPIVALAATLLSCEGALLTAPPNSTLVMQANPTFVASNGGTSRVIAVVTEQPGTAVPDGTVVQWFTDLGQIDPETRTRRGIATANFIADSRSGIAHVTAVSGAATVTPAGGLEITVGNVNVRAIRLRAVPTRITISNSTHVIATVIDAFGNPIANVPVYFDVVENRDTDFFDSAGGPIFTNNNGEAEDVLRTRRSGVGVITVQATAAGAGVFVISETFRIPVL